MIRSWLPIFYLIISTYYERMYVTIFEHRIIAFIIIFLFPSLKIFETSFTIAFKSLKTLFVLRYFCQEKKIDFRLIYRNDI